MYICGFCKISVQESKYIVEILIILEEGLCLDADRIFLIPWEKLLFGQLIFFQYHNTLIPQSLQVPFSVP